MSDPLLLRLEINPESRVKVARALVRPVLRRGAWVRFRIEIDNAARTTARLRASSPQAPAQPGARDRWLDLRLEPDTPLSGSPRESRTLLLRARDAGWREATLAFDVGQGTQDLGFRGEVAALFRCEEQTP